MNLVNEVARIEKILIRQLAQMTDEECNDYLDFLKVCVKKHIDNVELTPDETNLYDRYTASFAVEIEGELALSAVSVNPL